MQLAQPILWPVIAFSVLHSHPSSLVRPKFEKPKTLFPISCSCSESPENITIKEEKEKSRFQKNSLDLVKLSVTLTVISASLPQASSAAAKVSEKKRLGKKTEALTPEELEKWTKGLPVVSHRLAYSEILDLKRENKLKHIVKPPNVGLKQRPEVVLVVLEDNKPYLGFLSKIPIWMFSLVKPKPQSKKALELKRVREEFKRRKNEELAKMREDREMMEQAMKMQKKMEEKQKRNEMKKLKYEESLRQARVSSRGMSIMWERLASDSNVSTALGSGARVRRVQSKRLPQYLERSVDVKFSDVAGLGKIRLELEEIVKFFTHGEMYRRRGVKIPGWNASGGILLCGPPGVGKTLLAKAVAGEAGVNFFSISASQFVEIYVGVGASRVRALYQEARENAPSVVFIDELDAVGRERGLIKGSGGQERDATLNQLLVCLDGFEGRGEVITIASTNRPDILDPALVRPGRFDRKIYIPKPGLIGRVEILQVHARKKPMAPDVDYTAVASMTDGMVGAELANIIEVAAINMMRDGRTEITTDDLLQAAQMEERGMLDRKERSPEMWKQVAVNEAAMAVVAVNFPDLRNIEFVTISPRAGRELGYVRLKMDHMKFKEGMLSRQSLLDHITVQLAPRAADELLYGEDQLSTIWAETADNARSAARTLVLGGLSEKHYGLNNFWTARRIDEIDSEALRILNICYERAKSILQQNRELMDAVVHNLVEKKSLTKQEFFNLVELHGSLQTLPPSILDIRSAERLKLQNIMADNVEAAVHGSVSA
ncbi:hypothetical protein DH2020_041181 [Rehmannia glutinosa]|uniref:AAA+ ATPase domain-containing protein n=1 Tax=Rehmannia glutinosa TaxID=99300 RepID=A0ABR0USG3_REHGL